MDYEIRVARRADKALARFPAEDVQKLETSLRRLTRNPKRARPGLDVRPLRGYAKLFRLRVGDYRAFYVVDDEAMVVVVTDIRNRSHAYD